MGRWLFTRAISPFDGFVIGLAAACVATGHWAAAFVIVASGAVVSVNTEEKLAEASDDRP